MTFPSIQIRQTFARLGMDADLARIEQRQPKATFELRQVPAQLSIESPKGELSIDQSKAWDALGRGGVMEAMNRIYGQARDVFLQNLARNVEQGNRLAAIHKGGNPIAENAMELVFTFPEFNYYGPASYDNVDVYYTAHKPIIEVNQGGVELYTEVNRPELTAHRGKLDIYMLQYANVEIIPPVIDARI